MVPHGEELLGLFDTRVEPVLLGWHAISLGKAFAEAVVTHAMLFSDLAEAACEVLLQLGLGKPEVLAGTVQDEWGQDIQDIAVYGRKQGEEVLLA